MPDMLATYVNAPGIKRLTDWRGKGAAALTVIPVVFLGLAIVGAVRWFSPVPHWDMWDDYASAYLHVLDGHPAAFFFAQANEHRVVISKLLFWLDLSFFGGESRLLIPANVALMTLQWVALSVIAKRLLRGSGNLWIIASCVLAAPALSWLQEANITWGYQSQFFLAYLFPLLAFACIALSVDTQKPTLWFLVSLGFGLASFGTMANGVATMPLMLVLLFLLGAQSRLRIASICIIGALAAIAWFHHFFLIPHDRPNVAQFFQFVFSFFGAPFAIIFKHRTYIEGMGILFVVASVALASWWYRHRKKADPMFAAVLIFITFIGGTAAMIAFGRAGMGANASITSRYTTPALVGWCALALLFVYLFRSSLRAKFICATAGIFVALFLSQEQLKVFDDTGPATAEKRMFAGLALTMGIIDPIAVQNVYPMTAPGEIQNMKAKRDRLAEARISIFGDSAFTDAVAKIGNTSATEFHPCDGKIEHVESVAVDERYSRLSGWAFDRSVRPRRIPRFIYFSADGLIVGVGVTGFPRRDLPGLQSYRRRNSGFDGYAMVPAGTPLSLVCFE